jgi:uncharacterized protein
VNSARSSAAVFVALALLRAYKLLISPMFPGTCRFVPSCADYARDAVVRYGVLRGSWLAAKRLSRCHPFCEGGFDPVPDA